MVYLTFRSWEGSLRSSTGVDHRTPTVHLFYNDFPSCLIHSEVIVYADDTVIFVPGKDLAIIEARLSADMQRIHEWCTDNELILNLSKGKTESMLLGTSKRLSKQPPVMKYINKWNLHGGKTTMLYLNLSGHNIFKKRFGTSPEKHCLTVMPYRLFSRKLAKLT